MKDYNTTGQATRLAEVLQKEPKLGSMMTDGKMTTPLSNPEHKGSLISQSSPVGQPQLSRSSPRTEQEDQEDIDQFTLALSQACIALKQYGKTPSELRAMRDMFLTVLSDIPAREITKALFIHLRKADEIPTPKQLLDIINPPPEELSAAMYIQIMKECTVGGKLLWGDKKRYVDEFERREMEKIRGGSDIYRDAQTQLVVDCRALLTHNGEGYEGDGWEGQVE